MSQEYIYHAFISYSHKDKKLVSYFQKVLGLFQFPRDYWHAVGSDERQIGKLFRDDTDLYGYRLTESIEKALDQSEYLIVFCSKNSARSKWVDLEIQYFKESGRSAQIIPIKLTSPISFGRSREYYPQELRKLFQTGDVSQENVLTFSRLDNTFLRKSNLLKIINRLNGLPADFYLDEFQKKREIVNLMKLLGLFLVFMFAAVEIGLAYERGMNQFTAYESISWDSNMHIKGEGKKAVWSAGDEYYQLYYNNELNHAKVVQVCHVFPKGAGYSIPGSYLWDAEIMELFYDLNVIDGFQTMRLSKQILKNADGSVRLVKNYSLWGAVVDLSISDDSSEPFFLPDDYTLGFAGSSDEEASDYSSCRIIEEYNEKNELSVIWFLLDSSSYFARDKHGCSGIQYIRDEKGNITSAAYLDWEGNVLQTVPIDYRKQ